jgi:FtsZ-binding cell division protein ZapB
MWISKNFISELLKAKDEQLRLKDDLITVLNADIEMLREQVSELKAQLSQAQAASVPLTKENLLNFGGLFEEEKDVQDYIRRKDGTADNRKV